MLKSGDAEGAGKLAAQALKDHTADPARADYLLALSWLMKGDMDSAANDFHETIRLAQDPRLLAWSHIYLGRIADVREERPDALAEYKTAMAVRDGQPDTLQAAQKGLAAPFALPHAAAPGARRGPRSEYLHRELGRQAGGPRVPRSRPGARCGRPRDAR